MTTAGRILTVLFCGLTLVAVTSAVRAERAESEKGKAEQEDSITWHDCRQIGVEGKGWTDTLSYYDRLPAKAQGKAPKSVWSLSHNSAGLCVRFTTDAPSIRVRWTLDSGRLALPHMPATGASGVDLYVKTAQGRWRFVNAGWARAVSNTAVLGLPSGEQYLLYLPLYNGVKAMEIGIPKGRKISACAASPNHRKPVVIYGTSITQGACASRPGMAWTAIVGRRLDVPIINLGFSGSGKMEMEMADLLAELDPSIYVLDCMANMSRDQVSERVEPFVKRLRQARPKTPILLAERSSVRNVFPTDNGRLLRNAYQKLTAEGADNLYFLSGEGMLGDDGEGTVDGSHPNDLGMMRVADAFAKCLHPILQGPSQ